MVVNLDKRAKDLKPTKKQFEKWAEEPLYKLAKLIWSLFLIYGNNLSLILPYLKNPFAMVIISGVIKAADLWNKRNGTKIVTFFKKKKK